MKQFLKILMSFLMGFSMIFVLPVKVEAKEYAFGCEGYELAWVNDEGGFDTVGCYGSFSEAKAAMTQDDYVVRHSSSKSPTKIVAIKSGIAISYPRRNGSTTLDVYQHQNHITESEKYKSTYVTQHRELFQPETVSYNGNGEGNVKFVLQGFEGYASLSGMDLVPMKFIEKGLTITLGGQTNDNGVPEDPFEMIPKMSHYSVVQHDNYKDLVYTYYSGYDGKAYPLTLGPAANWMAVGQTYYSKDGYNFYADMNMSNYLATYYSYYVFLPLRSRSNIQGSTLDAYLASKGFTEKPKSTSTNDLTERQSQLAGEGQMFVDSQNVYGVNALLTYAMACNESGYGRSTYAVSKNNLFGWAAVDSNPDNATYFNSVAMGIQEQMAYNLRGYLDIFDVRYFGMHLGNKESGFNVKYASDPYWGYKIAAIAYDIDKFSRNYDGTLSDNDAYSLGLINTFKTPYYRTASTSSEVMFTSEYSSEYQKNHIVILNGETNGFYQVQSPNAILPDGSILKNKVSGVQQPASSYDFARSIGFILADKVTLLNEFSHVTIPGQTPEGDFIFNLSEFSLNNQGVLTISGSAYRPGIYITQANQMVHTLKVFDEFYDEMLEARMTTTLKENSQDYAQFTGTVDMNALEDGKYYFRLNSDYSSFDEYCDTRVLSLNAQSVESDTRKFTFASSGSTSWLTIETKEIPVEPEKPELSPDSKLIQSLSDFSYHSDDSVLSISGFSFITLLNADSNTQITHSIILKDMESLKEYRFIAKTTESSSPIEMLDGYNYSKINYDVDIQLRDVPAGNYTILIEVENNGLVKKSNLIDLYTDFIPEDSYLDGYLVKFSKNSVYSYRYELSIEKNQISYSTLIHKPTTRVSGFGLDSVSLNDGKLSIQGLAWIYNVNFGSNNSPVQNILLMKNDGTYTSHSTKNTACAVDYTSILKTKFNWDNICFNSSIDLTDLPEGEYRIYMDVSSESYRDIYDATNLYGLSIQSSVFENRTYSIITSKVKDRMILKIEKNK